MSKTMFRNLSALLITSFVCTGCILIVPLPSQGPNKALVQSPGQVDAFGVRLNRFRRENDLPPVSLNTTLTRAAQKQSSEIRVMGKLVHYDRAGASLTTRVKKAGYPLCFGNESLASGFDTEDQVLQGWANSPDHRANLLSTKVTEYGIAHDGDWYTLIMGSRC